MTRVAVVLPSAGGAAHLRPLDAARVRLTGGFWAERLRTNRERTIPHGWQQLQRVGTLANFRLAAGAGGQYRALTDDSGLVFPFLDTDLYKWLEAVGWELGRAADPDIAAAADEAIAAITAAQAPDGYLNTYVQVLRRGRRFEDLQWGHELYCFGHLIQAAVAWKRALDDDRLLDVAVRAADLVAREFGPGSRDAIDGHPEIEMALVELYRTVGERPYLDLAALLLERRGRGRLDGGRFGAPYWQDHVPVREASTVAGHAVRQVYLDCGAVDVAMETGDGALLEAVRRRWHDMIATRSYLTGGLGSHHRDEAFGDPFELPPDRAYAETCAAIGSVMLAWRLLLATGDPTCADVIERTMHNGVLSGLSLDGTHFFYVNPLHRRSWRAAAPEGHGERAEWYPCACCPPNLMRTLATWEHLLATSDGEGIQLHQYAPAELAADTNAGPVRLAVETGYPWTGRIEVTVLETPVAAWMLSLRLPAWCRTVTVQDPGAERIAVDPGDRTVRRMRTWTAGDRLILELGLEPRITTPDPRIDAIRGCVAFERGPFVYAVESADLPAGADVDAIAVPADAAATPVERPDVGESAVGLRIPVRRVRVADPRWPYTAGGGDGEPGRAPEEEDAGAIPYFAWANRDVGGMRVWLPRATNGDPGP